MITRVVAYRNTTNVACGRINEDNRPVPLHVDFAEEINLPAGPCGDNARSRLAADQEDVGRAPSARGLTFVDRAFVVGGDAKEPGDYSDGLSLLREMRSTSRSPRDRRPTMSAIGLHMYTFNAVETFETWRRAYLAKLGAAVAAA
jgi:hypothetical protein